MRDGRQALALAQPLAQRMPAPPHLELLAMAQAAAGDFEQARLMQRQLAFLPPRLGGVDIEKIEAAIDAFEAGGLPDAAVWPEDDPLLRPPPVQAGGPMREYPAALPY